MRLAGLLLPVVSGFVLFSPWGRIEQDGLTDPYLSPNLEIEWSGPESFDLYETVFLWSMPANALSQDGLGGGITWALHPRFCEQILPMFPEASPAGTFATFLTCADLRHAVASAFNTWADNHEKITFLDVTDRCVNMTGTNCASAEVVVQVYEASLTEAMRTQLDSGSVDFTPRLTSGVTLPQGLGLNRAWINVSSASCWYLDETFCYTFHRLREDHNLDVQTIVAVICSVAITLASGGLLILTMFFCLAVCGVDRCTPSSQLQEVEAMARAARRISSRLSRRSHSRRSNYSGRSSGVTPDSSASRASTRDRDESRRLVAARSPAGTPGLASGISAAGRS